MVLPSSSSPEISIRLWKTTSKPDDQNAESMERQKTVRREIQQARKTAPAGEFKPSGREAVRAASSGPGVISLVLILGGLMLTGIGVIIGLRYMFGAF